MIDDCQNNEQWKFIIHWINRPRLFREAIAMDLSQLSTQHSFVETQTLERETRPQEDAVFKDMTDYEKEMYVNRLIFVLWYSERTKVPVRRHDLAATVLGRHFTKAFVPLMRVAKRKLEAVLHVTVVEIRKDVYILANRLRPHCDGLCMQSTFSPEERARQNLLSVVLTIIFMSGGRVETSLLYKALAKLKIDENEPHAMFGEVRRLLSTDWVRQAYLIEVKNKTRDPPVCEFTFGERASVEYRKEDLLMYVAMLHRQRPEHWYCQFQELQKDREERVERASQPTQVDEQQAVSSSSQQSPSNSSQEH